MLKNKIYSTHASRMEATQAMPIIEPRPAPVRRMGSIIPIEKYSSSSGMHFLSTADQVSQFGQKGQSGSPLQE